MENLTSDKAIDGTVKATYGQAFTVTLTADSGYGLPAAVTVTVGGKAATAGTDYTYTQSNGKIEFTAAQVTGAITITASGTPTT